jgi:hypothetical protein
VTSHDDNPIRQLAAAWEAATAVVTEWAERATAVTIESFHKLTSDPAIRAVLDSWRIAPLWARRSCECRCASSHPADVGVCDQDAVITRRLAAGHGEVEIALCAPCAVAQGVAELPR